MSIVVGRCRARGPVRQFHAPHLHFQLSNAATFDGSEGLLFTFDRSDLPGPETEAQLFGQDAPWTPSTGRHRQAPLLLDIVVIGFPASR
ncbi:hypothetical protein ABQJ54_12695 [Rhodanobacter sp. Si-c]|uniref:Intradiol ring-cleavage dioxygenases domain-containing protein n=1 Tax=Rhodanobacter lycopersici TaxID=3162487 RepID=A0ABV3QFN6_9GAMM